MYGTARKLMILAAAAILSMFSTAGLAGEKTRLGRNWSPQDRVSFDRIDYAIYDALLSRYVDQRGDVDYSAWKSSSSEVASLDHFLDHLSRADPNRKSSSSARLAFWINAYNAVTIKGILREYPTSSIKNHAAKLYGYNIWHDLLLKVGTQEYSLDQIEHKILRKMGEPRIHFAIVCASRSCPRLRAEAYRPQTLERQLSDNTRAFFADPQNFRYDVRRRHIEVSKILDWFGSDFGGDDREVLAAIAIYLPNEQARQLAALGRVRISYFKYDWSLNDQRPSESNAKQ